MPAVYHNGGGAGIRVGGGGASSLGGRGAPCYATRVRTRRGWGETRPWPAAAALLCAALLATACATPVGVSRAGARTIHRYLTQSALSADLPSTFSLIELRRYALADAFRGDPDAALARLRELALEHGLPAEALFALSELWFLRAEDSRER